MRVVLFNSLGNVVKVFYEGIVTNKNLEFELIGSNLSTGIYFVKVENENSIISGKCILVK